MRTSSCCDDGHLPRFEEDDAAGVLHDGRRVTGDEVLAIAQADHHAAGIADAGGDDLVRLIGGNQHHDVGALDLLKVRRAASHEIGARRQIVLHQVHDGFGVGLRLEFARLRRSVHP